MGLKRTNQTSAPSAAPEIRGIADTKKSEQIGVSAATVAAESGITAAIDRLKAAKPKAETGGTAPKAYAGRDFSAEAHGKTRCATWNAAMMSPALAGLRFENLEKFLVLVKQAADAGEAYAFGE